MRAALLAAACLGLSPIGVAYPDQLGDRPLGVAQRPCAREVTSNGSSLTLSIEAPTGNVSRLIYQPTAGWRFAPRPGNPARTPAAAPRPDGSTGVDEPLTVFIDGPTGFTYVWMRDAGWTFVGHLADQQP